MSAYYLDLSRDILLYLRLQKQGDRSVAYLQHINKSKEYYDVIAMSYHVMKLMVYIVFWWTILRN